MPTISLYFTFITFIMNYLNYLFMVAIKEVLLYARRLEIRGISLDPSDTVDKITPITGTQNAIWSGFSL